MIGETVITIKEMAKLLGTSTTTVSNVIHKKTKEVSPEMYEKISNLIEEHNYVPNINARNLANNRSKIIGLVVRTNDNKYDNYIKDPFGGEIVGTIEKYVRERDYFVMLYMTDDIDEIITSVSGWNIDGLILLGIGCEEGILLKRKIKKPMVFVDSYFGDSMMEYDNIGTDDRGGGYMITEHLLQNGHRKIAFLADNCRGVDYERFTGYKEALSKANVSYRDDNFILLRPNRADLTMVLAEAYRRAKEFTAFVCASDFYAVHILNYLIDRGVRVPDDLSITGFDHNEYSRIARPILTTVAQDVRLKAKRAVEKLFVIMGDEESAQCLERIPVSLVVGESVKSI